MPVPLGHPRLGLGSEIVNTPKRRSWSISQVRPAQSANKVVLAGRFLPPVNHPDWCSKIYAPSPRGGGSPTRPGRAHLGSPAETAAVVSKLPKAAIANSSMLL